MLQIERGLTVAPTPRPKCLFRETAKTKFFARFFILLIVVVVVVAAVYLTLSLFCLLLCYRLCLVFVSPHRYVVCLRYLALSLLILFSSSVFLLRLLTLPLL